MQWKVFTATACRIKAVIFCMALFVLPCTSHAQETDREETLKKQVSSIIQQ